MNKILHLCSVMRCRFVSLLTRHILEMCIVHRKDTDSEQENVTIIVIYLRSSIFFLFTKMNIFDLEIGTAWSDAVTCVVISPKKKHVGGN